MRAEDQGEELRRQLVVLLIGFLGVLGDGALRHLAGEGQIRPGLGMGQALARRAHQKIDAQAGQAVGRGTAFKSIDGAGQGGHARIPVR